MRQYDFTFILFFLDRLRGCAVVFVSVTPLIAPLLLFVAFQETPDKRLLEEGRAIPRRSQLTLQWRRTQRATRKTYSGF
jgi:hypothetical protein